VDRMVLLAVAGVAYFSSNAALSMDDNPGTRGGVVAEGGSVAMSRDEEPDVDALLSFEEAQSELAAPVTPTISTSRTKTTFDRFMLPSDCTETNLPLKK